MNFHQDSLVPVSALPQIFQGVFSFRFFNSVQSECFSSAYLSDDNLVVSAPTGSGKTGLFELCILRLLTRLLTPEGLWNHPRGALKIVYVAPTKALIQEKVREWDEKFGSRSLGLICREVTGDNESIQVKDLHETDIILTTPEKFDSTTRRCRDHGRAGFVGDIALLLIDEVHLLNDTRGAALEAIVSRMKMLARYPELKESRISRIRFVAVSATIPNIEDLGEWLMAPPRAVKRFGEEMRPVKLTSKVFGYSAAKNDYLFEKRLQVFLYDIILQYSSEKPTLVFCPTRKGAQDAALKLAETVSKAGAQNPFIKTQEQRVRLQAAAAETNEKNMQSCIPFGVGFHSGGVGFAERGLVEGLFLQGDLPVLCTTMTLAHGMNLPAHLVVIKSTQFYNKEQGRYLEYDRATLLQMCGRAGRPQFDDSGTVIIMTKNETKHLYQNLLSGSEPVESELLPCMTEHLNAEIVMMTVSDVGLALDWLKCSFLYIRLRKNPKRYGVPISLPEEQMEKHLKGICLRSINELAKYGMVEMDEYGFTLRHQEPGRLMAKYYLNIETMKSITRIPERSNIEELLNTLTKAQELSWVQLRRYEKKQLNSINQETGSRIKFRVVDPKGKPKKRIQTSSEKIFVLVNDSMSGEPSILDFTMTQDVSAICTNGARVSRCMSDYFIYFKRYSEVKSALQLTKCLRQRLWDDSAYQLKQLPGIGMVTAKAFLTAGISNFEKLETADPRHLEQITGRKYPFGDHMKSTLKTLPPKVQMVVRDTGLRIGDKREFLLELTRTESSRGSETGKWYFADLIAGDESENSLLFHERIRLEQFPSPYVVPVYSRNDISVALISDQFVGVDIFHKPVPHTSLDESIESMKPSKSQQQKRKFMDSAGPSPVCSSTRDPESRLKLLSIQKQPSMEHPTVSCAETSSNGLGTTSDFKHGESNTTTAALGEPEAYSREPDHTSASRMTPAGKDKASTFHSTSPRGQDLRSLQSFLADSNMFSDAYSLVDHDMAVVAPVPNIPLQPVIEKPFQHRHGTSPSASSGTRFINGHDHNSLEQEDCGAVQFGDNEDDRRKILSGRNSNPVLHTPRGQDLKSLQSFLDDPNTCYDVMSLTDLMVDAPSNHFHLPPEEQQKKVNVTMPPSGFATGCSDGGEDKFVDLHGDLEFQDMVVEDKFLRPQTSGRTTALRQLLSRSTGRGTTASVKSPDKLTCLDGRTITDREIELDACAVQTNQVPSRSSPGCHDQPGADGSASSGSSLPHFNLILPKSTVMRDAVKRAENEASGCIYNTVLDSGYRGTGNSHSVRDSADQNDSEVFLGTKSIFSFLYD